MFSTALGLRWFAVGFERVQPTPDQLLATNQTLWKFTGTDELMQVNNFMGDVPFGSNDPDEDMDCAYMLSLYNFKFVDRTCTITIRVVCEWHG